jgi:hypothetical protein
MNLLSLMNSREIRNCPQGDWGESRDYFLSSISNMRVDTLSRLKSKSAGSQPIFKLIQYLQELSR